MNNLIRTDENIILKMLENAGYEAYFVGGCVRDMLRGMDFDDVDITTNAQPEDIKKVFFSAFGGNCTVDTGIKHGTVTVLMPIGDANASRTVIPVEITTYRSDGDYSDSRHPDGVTFVKSLEEDLARRDFTINAIAMDCRGEIRDPFNGREDINAGIIKAVGNPKKRFEEDALRIMRGLRFGATTGFVIESETKKAFFETKGLLKNISAERIYEEFSKIIVGQSAGKVLREYVDVLGEVMPEVPAMKGFKQYNPYHKYDVLEHCIRAMEAVKTTEKNKTYMKMAAIFHDVGKPETFFFDEEGIGHFYGHPAKGRELTDRMLKRLKADSFTTERVGLLVANHDLLFERDEKLLKRRLNRFGSEILTELLEIKRADNLATGNMSHDLMEKFDDIEDIIERILAEEQCFSLKDLNISGKDLIGIGIKEGPEIGRTLNMLLEAVMDGTLENNRHELIKAACDSQNSPAK